MDRVKEKDDLNIQSIRRKTKEIRRKREKERQLEKARKAEAEKQAMKTWPADQRKRAKEEWPKIVQMIKDAANNGKTSIDIQTPGDEIEVSKKTYSKESEDRKCPIKGTATPEDIDKKNNYWWIRKLDEHCSTRIILHKLIEKGFNVSTYEYRITVSWS